MSMRIFVAFEARRDSLDVKPTDDVANLKAQVTDIFQIDTRGGQFVVLNYHGSDLLDDWYLSDIGIHAGATLKVNVREELKPTLYVYSVFNDETIEILEDVNPITTTVAELKTFVVRRCGVPVTVFRLTTNDGVDLYDVNPLDKYNIELGSTVRMYTWDGWNEFLKAAMIGHTAEVLKTLAPDDMVAKYQCRVALFIGAHHGHMDLSTVMLRQGVRSDEAIGDHPVREWCDNSHIESQKTPIHEAAEHGQLQILRIFVYNNICCVTCKDGNALTPLSVALRKQQREVALYLLTKQWSSVTYSAVTLPLSIYSQVRKWCDKAKDRVLLVHGVEKSSLKIRHPYRQNGALCGQGVHVDGFSYSAQNASPKTSSYHRIKDRAKTMLVKKASVVTSTSSESGVTSPDDSAVGSSVGSGDTGPFSPTPIDMKLPRLNDEQVPSLVAKYRQKVADKKRRTFRPRSRSTSTKPVTFPPINMRMKSSSHQDLTAPFDTDSDSDADIEITRNTKQKSTFIRTSAKGKRRKPKSNVKLPEIKQASQNSDAEEKKREKAKWRRQLLIDNAIPLPVLSLEAKQKPFFHIGTRGENIPNKTLKLYEDIIGCSTREKAIESLAIASTFKEKPWLQQVRLAMSFSRQHIKRVGKDDNGGAPEEDHTKERRDSGSIVENENSVDSNELESHRDSLIENQTTETQMITEVRSS
ncbi:protein ANKUB1-like [Glandiceps talaboti]